MQGADEELVEAAASGNLKDYPLSKSDKVWLEFVEMLASESYRNTPERVQELRDHGWEEAQIRETVLVVGMFSMFNRVADAFGLEDPDYFAKERSGQAIRPAERSS